MQINWKYGKEIHQQKIIQVCEWFEISFPEDFISIVKANDGGKPTPEIFKLKNGTEKIFNYLLSFDQSSKHNIIYINNILRNIHQVNANIVAFADDPFGNLICFEFAGDSSPKVVFWEHETNELLPIANSFSELLENMFR